MIIQTHRVILRNVHRRLLHTSSHKPSIGFVFDIDGVLLKGKNAIAGANTTLSTLQSLKIPFILFTNGGGTSEATRLSVVSERLQLEKPLDIRQIVQSHTPFKSMVHKYSNVLVVGGPEDSARAVAQSYGFQNVLLPIDVIRETPSIWPFHRYSQQQLDAWGILRHGGVKSRDVKIDAILVFNDPRDMGSDIQIIMDYLNSQTGCLNEPPRTNKSETSQMPIIFSNNDLLWSNEYPYSRFGQGAFKIMIQSLYAHLNDGKPLTSSLTLGKPEKLSYQFAHGTLINYKHYISDDSNDLKKINTIELGQDLTPESLGEFDKVFMVGDNPESDIKGANNYQNNWESILVRTGVYKDGDFDRNPQFSQPTVGVFDDVKHGVFSVLKKYNYI